MAVVTGPMATGSRAMVTPRSEPFGLGLDIDRE
jgi:hypothetical protein